MPRLSVLLRLSAVVSALAGVVHLTAPDRLLTVASWSYDRVLSVRFHPRENATRRVRLVGAAMLVAAPVLNYLAAWVE